MVNLRYFKGLLLSDTYAPGLKWENRFKSYVGQALRYREVKDYFLSSGIEVEDHVMNPLPTEVPRTVHLKLRDYQEEAYSSWSKDRRGIVVLPTGAGKTMIALKAISELGVSTLVVVPTIDLLWQWKASIERTVGIKVGAIGGGEDDLKGVTVTTYDSAYRRAEQVGNLFSLVVFDEVHHLPSEGNRLIAEVMASPFRLGLTATVEREDGRHRLLDTLVGPVVYSRRPSDLAGQFLADYEILVKRVDLLPEERQVYERLRKKFQDFLKEKRITLKSREDFMRFISVASRDRKGREALLAWSEATRIAVNSAAKIGVLREVLREYSDRKTVIFTRNNEFAYRISKEFLIPVITYKTPKPEREDIINGFRSGKYKCVVTSNVLDEGVDVPDASLAVVMGGYGTRRQFIQRLGRVLRKVDGKRALLIEVVSNGTVDSSLSRRRKDASTGVSKIKAKKGKS